jgi:phosphopantothenoylcysteine decarboxylase/phosphopantothenate--cysteine ligase
MKVLLGVSGGVAAYKAVELVRELQRRQIDVQVAMTTGAEEFIRPLTFAAVSGHQVLTSLWQPEVKVEAEGEPGDFAIEHIALAQTVDAVVLAPATANLLAKLAHGMADDLLTTIALATRVPILVAPAMNVNMWEHPATQANLALLRERGVQVIEPGAGYLACGMTGGGRLAEVASIADAVQQTLATTSDLAGETVLITAGGTREPIDPVRFLGNRSSGKMGYALAEVALARGAKVILITAAQGALVPACEVIRVNTADQMRTAVLENLQRASILIKAAAVADFWLSVIPDSKLQRGGDLTLRLEPTPDIVAEAAKRSNPGTLIVAFAAETPTVESDLASRARAKLQRKGVDAIFANDISIAGAGFDSDRNAGIFITSTREVVMNEMPKRELATRILDEVKRLRLADHPKKRMNLDAAHGERRTLQAVPEEAS